MKHKILLILILLLALILRWYKIDNPLADWHSWRQADTASVSQEYLKNGIDLLHPRFHDLSSFPSDLDNPQGYRMAEFPLYNAIHAFIAGNFTTFDLDQWGRVLSIVYSLISIIFLYALVSLLTDRYTGLLSAFFMAVLPFSVYYSRVVLPDPLMITLTLAGSYYFVKATSQPKFSHFFLSSTLLAFALLVKPYAVFYFLPLVWLGLLTWGFKLLLKPSTYIFLIIVFAPLILWRLWIQQFPEGIPSNLWLYNYMNIRLRPAWWRWLFYERLSLLILGAFGLLPFLTGLVTKLKPKEHYFFHLWLVGIFAYLVIFAGGNVTHDYYQAITIPVLAVFLAKGTRFLVNPNPSLIWPFTPLLVSACIALSLAFSWYQIKGYYQVNNWNIVEAGIRADKLLPADAKVIAPYNGDTAFLYQTRRSGWPISFWGIPYLLERGATHYVSVNFDDQTNQVISDPNNTILEQTDRYVIVELGQGK